MFGGPLQTKTEEAKCNYLMIWAGEKGKQIFSTWNLQADDKKKLERYYTGFESYCKPRSNQIYARYKLRCREQEDGEKFEHFVTSLKLLLNDCGYDAAIHDEMIRESIVFGVKSSKIREKLINEGSDLTLQKCLDIARTYELSQEQLKVIDNQASIHYVKSKRSANVSLEEEQSSDQRRHNQYSECYLDQQPPRYVPTVGDIITKKTLAQQEDSSAITV